MLGAGEPLRVKQGQRVLMRLLNASATENVVLALPGHTFRILAMDGNPVPNPKEVEVVSLAVAERVDAIVEMKSPGVWVLGSTLEKARQMGLGIVVEYAGKTGPPVWKDPQNAAWDYTQFANSTPAAAPDETIPLTLMDLGRRRTPSSIPGPSTAVRGRILSPSRYSGESATGWSSRMPPAISTRCICIGIRSRWSPSATRTSAA